MSLLGNYKSYNKGIIFKGAAHSEKELSRAEKTYLLKKYNAWYLRNTYNFDCKEETSFWYVICDSPVIIENYKTGVRNQIRKSLKTLDFRKITSETLVDSHGYNAYLKSYTRYKVVTEKILSEDVWTKQILENVERKEFWGAFIKESGMLIAYGDALIQDRGVKYTALKGDLSGTNKNLYPFYGLLFTMNTYYLNEMKMLYVNDGVRSISQHSNIQDFLLQFHFRKAYCKMDITYVWWLRAIIKLIYPFRDILKINKVTYLLRQESIRRTMQINK